MNAPCLDGWVPFRVFWQGAEPWLDWCYLGETPFREPFFDGTIHRAMRQPFNNLFRHRTPIATLREWHAANPGLPPSAFIFHMSRSGSTLVSQMLASLPRFLVLAEPGPIDALARSELRAPAASDSERVDWLRWMISALGQRRTGHERHYVVKLEPATTMALPLLRRCFPEVPWIFLYRHPVEAMASVAQQVAGAMLPHYFRPDPTGLPAPQVAAMDVTEYAARIIGKFCEAACRHFDDRGLAVNYSQLPDVFWEGIAQHCGFEFREEEIAGMREASGFHSKDRSARFEADAERRRKEAPQRLRTLAEEWIMPHYQNLESLRQDRNRYRRPAGGDGPAS